MERQAREIELIAVDGVLQPVDPDVTFAEGERFRATLVPLVAEVLPRVGGPTGWQRPLLLVLAALLIALVLAVTAQAGREADLRWTLPVWIAASVAALAAVQGRAERRAAAPSRRWWFGLLAVVLLAALFRGWQAGDLPATLSGDEGNFGLEALRVLNGELRQPFSAGWLSVPTLTFFFNAPSLALFGNSLFGLRLPWIVLGVLNVLLAGLLATRLAGPRIGLLSAGLLAGFHYHIHYARLAINNIADPFFTTLALWLVVRAIDRRSRTDWALAGLTIAVAQYFYFGARLIVVLAVLLIVLAASASPRAWLVQHGRGVAAALTTALTAGAPIVLFALQYPDIYNARINQTGIFQSGWFARELAGSGQSAAAILFEQLRRALGAYHYQPDPTVWYSPGAPLLDPLSGGLMLIGGLLLLQGGRRRMVIVPLWWVLVLLVGAALTENPPASQRIVSSAVPAMIMLAAALDVLVQTLRERVSMRVPAAALLVPAVTLFVAANSWFYFADYTPRRVYASHNAVISTEIGHFARRELGADWQLVLLGPPQMGVNFGSSRFLAPHVPEVDLPPQADVAAVDAQLQAAPHTAVVALPFRREELLELATRYPGGVLRDVPDPVDGSILFSVYQLNR